MDQHPAYINYGNNVVGADKTGGGFPDYPRRGELERTTRKEWKCNDLQQDCFFVLIIPLLLFFDLG